MTGKLGYNTNNDRYGLLVSDLWEIEGFHCGACLDVWDDQTDQWVPTRMEMHYIPQGFPRRKNAGWYLVGTPYAGEDLEGLRVRIGENDTKCDT